ncbi:ectomycorrhiza-regulated small secreted protein [Laccaria bicolor S238N-H82]|uniref:Ectomycorrhiza-regulated small secreted protein n=1 Tax=Laccaria bicolor (strain S238N-H82 / ATCC MYA-4686) TaxID=486041 RepID=B0DVV7_LACBS|nr:ectomycorrhiza-regulated small secreted protein [Laccaria bicolor S238N-H82]EDR01368.1 ectomycorrhiza-regulated small secreted protein [Laccaria bicolor S238N-H82]|eukprot:XP_001888075.1 ectomycorrhiza-regulated small secreted protein [Laccaria bicolor S238N-H82]
MHSFKFTTRPFALVLAIVCLAIATPTPDVHADPGHGSGAVVHAVGNAPDGAVIKYTITTHLPEATSPTDKTLGGSTLEPDSSECFALGTLCSFDSNCCSGHCNSIPLIFVLGFCYP